MIKRLIHLEDITTLTNYAPYKASHITRGKTRVELIGKKNIHKYNCLKKAKAQEFLFPLFPPTPKSVLTLAHRMTILRPP